MSALAELAAAADPALAAHARSDPGPAELAPRVPDPRRAFVVEAVREGYLLHYDEPRAFEGMDPDLRLLGGDALYALGLARLAEAGDLAAVAELADLISHCAAARAAGDPGLAEELWEASLAALTGGGAGAAARAAAAARSGNHRE